MVTGSTSPIDSGFPLIGVKPRLPTIVVSRCRTVSLPVSLLNTRPARKIFGDSTAADCRAEHRFVMRVRRRGGKQYDEETEVRAVTRQNMNFIAICIRRGGAAATICPKVGLEILPSTDAGP